MLAGVLPSVPSSGFAHGCEKRSTEARLCRCRVYGGISREATRSAKHCGACFALALSYPSHVARLPRGPEPHPALHCCSLFAAVASCQSNGLTGGNAAFFSSEWPLVCLLSRQLMWLYRPPSQCCATWRLRAPHWKLGGMVYSNRAFNDNDFCIC